MESVDGHDFEALWGQARPRVYGMALSMLRSREDAEDVTQDIAEVALQRGRTVTDHHKPEAWLLAATRNVVLKRLRRRRTEIRYWAAADDREPTIWLDLPIEPELVRAIHFLTPDEAAVVFLRAIDDRTFADIGTIVGKNSDAARQIHHRARRKAREVLGDRESLR